jgi:type III restriction enzyme
VYPFYPDFIFIRKEKQGLSIDILDPHMPDLDDAWYKAVGLAEYAAKHGYCFGRIELISLENEVIKRLDLSNERVREKVLVNTNNEQLKQLFNGSSSDY